MGVSLTSHELFPGVVPGQAGLLGDHGGPAAPLLLLQQEVIGELCRAVGSYLVGGTHRNHHHTLAF